jgi:hypothetical protein
MGKKVKFKRKVGQYHEKNPCPAAGSVYGTVSGWLRTNHP